MSRLNLLDHPICFSHPLRLGPGPSLLQVPFAMFLVDLLRPRLVVELGINDGIVYSAYSQAIKQLRLDSRCRAVSWHVNDGHQSEGLDDLISYHDSTYKDFSEIIRVTPADALSKFADRTIDLLRVSNRPPNSPISTWIQGWLPKMSASGVILINNINAHQNGIDDWKSWQELSRLYQHFDLNLDVGIGLLAVGKQSPLRSLIEMDERDRSQAREFFHKLGLRLLIQSRLDAKSGALDETVEELREKNESLKTLAGKLAVTSDHLQEERLTVAGLSNELAAKAIQLNNILNCRAWRWVTRYGHFKNRFVTPVLDLFRSDKKPQLTPPTTYKQWVKQHGTLTSRDREAIKGRIPSLAYQPLISIVMPVYNVDEEWLRRAIESVRGQLYDRWELCIADDHSFKPHVRKVLNEYAGRDARIKIVFRSENGHISEASNSALEIASGEFVALLDHDDELAAHALYMILEELNAHPEADLIYSDEDKIDVDGRRFDPHFKTDWNPDLFYSMNFVSHLGVYRTSVLKRIGGFRKGLEGSQDYDLVLRFVEQIPEDHIRHVPHILYHWRAIPDSVAANVEGKEYAFEAARNAIRSHFERIGKKVEVTSGIYNYHRVMYPIPSPPPLVSFIIGTRDRSDLLEQAVDGILETDYAPVEIIIVDNQSTQPESLEYLERIKQDPRIRVVSYNAKFNFSAINNLGVKEARGEVICLLNNDIKIISSGWLKEMVSHALRPEIGAVGAKLYYENATIQHAGVIIGVGGVAGHSHKHFPRTSVGYAYRTMLTQGYSAVTAACLVMRRSLFLEMGGLNELNLPVAFNDVDLCLRLRAQGYRIVWTPYAELYHLESASRGPEETLERWPGFARECAYFRARWGDQLWCDPYYNPNLTISAEDFSFSASPRLTKPWTQTDDSDQHKSD